MARLISVLGGCGPVPTPKPTPTPTAPFPTPTRLTAGYIPAGVIEFGGSVTGVKLHSVASTFSKNKAVAWVAHLSQAPEANGLTWIVRRVGGQGRHPAIVTKQTVAVRSHASYLANRLTPKQLASNGITFGGQYQMQYSKGTRVLASGDFALLSGSGRPPGY